MLPSLRAIDWSGFLGRDPLPGPTARTLSNLCGQTVLVTGAGGSIGSALVARLIQIGAGRVVLLESSESRLFAIQRAIGEIADRQAVTTVLGSVGDRALVDDVFAEFKPRIVFHAAAYKHVPLMEEQPLAAIGNNVFGTVCLAEAARAHGAQVVLLSTDKAVEPASVMGATKRVAERIVLRLGGIALRLGNVLATRDSVAEIFAEQLELGVPLSVTDPAARRYFLTIDEAVNLLLTAAGLALDGARGTLLVPRLEAEHFITDLALYLGEKLAAGRKPEFEFTRPRPGDKEAERLWGTGERVLGHAADGLLQIDWQEGDADTLDGDFGALRRSCEDRDIAASIELLKIMVPGYVASATVMAAANLRRMQVRR